MSRRGIDRKRTRPEKRRELIEKCRQSMKSPDLLMAESSTVLLPVGCDIRFGFAPNFL